jgi:NADPH:quinone reductase-like Zn-dependent oxidoreductase
VIITALSTRGAINQKLAQRVLGSIIGGLILAIGATAFLFPRMESITSLVVLVAAVCFVSAWCAIGRRFSYVGLQIALAFYLVAFEGFGPSIDLAPARDRFAGIVVGLIVMWVVFGEWLLQTAAASSVGKFVLQLAQQYRFKTINVIRRREQEKIIRSLGGDEVICTDDEDLMARLQELTAGKGVERAIDCVAGELGAEIARNLTPAGTMLVYGALSSHRQTDPAKFIMPLFAPRLIYSTATVRGWWLPHWVRSQPLTEMRAATTDLLTMLSKGALTSPATVQYPFENFQEAVPLADGEAGQQKVLLDFSENPA